MGTGGVQNVGPDLGDVPVVERLSRAARQGAQDGAHRGADVLPRRLPTLDVDVGTPVLVVRVQRIAQREQCGCLSRLPGRAQGEVLPLLDEQQEIVEVQSCQGRHAVVHLGFDWASGVEKTHGPSITRRPRRRTRSLLGRAFLRDVPQGSGIPNDARKELSKSCWSSSKERSSASATCTKLSLM